MKRTSEENSLRCSFCHKGKNGKLISSPNDYPRAYICDECVAVCVSILEDDRLNAEEAAAVGTYLPHPMLAHPLASELMEATQRWIREESLGRDGAEALGEMRVLASKVAGDVS